MINLLTNEASFGSRTGGTFKLVIWYLTPSGACQTLEEAQGVVSKMGLDGFAIKPVVVADCAFPDGTTHQELL